MSLWSWLQNSLENVLLSLEVILICTGVKHEHSQILFSLADEDGVSKEAFLLC